MRKLWEISEDLDALAGLLDGADGEISDDEAGRAIEQWFDELGAERDQKIDNYCALIRQYEADAAARQEEANRLRGLSMADENQAERLKKRLRCFFEKHGIVKLDTSRFKLALQANGGALPLIVPAEWEQDAASAPEVFQCHVIQLDRKAIREAIRNDEAPEGCGMGERGKHLRIR